MKKVKFTEEKLVGERTFRAGDVAELPDDIAQRILDAKAGVDGGTALLTVFTAPVVPVVPSAKK